MGTIWQHDEEGWQLVSPSGFPQEAALHDIVEQTPQLLPLAGSPQLVVLGREVLLGGNYADLIAVEPSGRLAVIEIKLARNPEARRAVIAQVLTYAAHLHGLDAATLERDVLGIHLQKRGYASLADAVVSNDQAGAVDTHDFIRELASSLAEGRFRLVLVLDAVPPELVRLVGYLEAVADKLVIDLVIISAFDIGETQFVVPQRVEPERQLPVTTVSQPAAQKTSASGGRFVEGATDFEAAIDEAPDDLQPLLRRLTEWAKELEHEGLVGLGTYHGKSNMLTLLPRLLQDNVGMVTIYNERRTNRAYLQFWRSVIERRAPESLSSIEESAFPAKVGQGTTTREISEGLLQALTAAYREAAKGHLSTGPPEPSD